MCEGEYKETVIGNKRFIKLERLASKFGSWKHLSNIRGENMSILL